jgi:hypothetical protein
MVGMAGVFSVVLAKMIEEQKETVGAARVTRQISILICGVLKMMFQPSLTGDRQELGEDGANRDGCFRYSVEACAKELRRFLRIIPYIELWGMS